MIVVTKLHKIAQAILPVYHQTGRFVVVQHTKVSENFLGQGVR